MPIEALSANQYEIKELELNALLEVTQAINNNLPEESLYKIFNFTLRANLNIKRLALYVLNEREGRADLWECKTNFGTDINFSRVMLNEHFLPIRDVTYVCDLPDPGLFEEFDIALPVSHKGRMLALVFTSGLRKEKDVAPDQSGTTFVQALSNIIIVAIENKKLARQQLAQEAVRKEMEIAQQVQQFLFPKNLPHEPGLRVEASYQPHHSVGGDYYDFLRLSSGQFLVCIADVSGKGVPAALLMSNFQAALRTIVRQTTNLQEIIYELNYQVMQSANGENFITFFVAIYDQPARTLRYVNAGHIPPILISRQHPTQLLEQGSVMLGSFQPLPFLNEGKVEDLEDFLLFAYTDGLTEIFNEQGEEFGTNQLQVYLEQHANQELPTLHRQLFRTLVDFRVGETYDDDITFMSMKVNAALLSE
ncbi:MAG: PP2C family protein-serine/threonine phosphatase [Tunicatimonas sp.]